jgi:hypothetical protein
MPDRMVIAYEDATGVLKPLTVGNADGAALPVELVTLLAGENQPLGVMEIVDVTDYWPSTFSGTATTVRKSIGAVGAPGDVLYGITLFNGSASNITSATLQDGTTTLAWIDLGALKTLAAGATATVMLPRCMRSQNGGWGITIACAGTMASVQIGAYGIFS